MLPETLDFRIKVSPGPAFTLDVEDSLPLQGITAIVGPSGGGKTTLLRALAGLEPLKDAEVQFRGASWDGRDGHVPTQERRIGFVFQDPALFPHLSVERNLAYGAKRREVHNYDAIVEALDLGALMQRSIERLSGGEARRVALGRALAADPAILFLDEPLTGLDRDRKSELLPYIGRAVAEARVPALYVTHSVDEITALADRVLGVEGGRLTGWKPAPIRLTATVVATSSENLTARIDGAPAGAGAEVSLPLIAGQGEKIGLGIETGNLMLSASHPGRSDALLQLPASVIEGDEGLALDVFGQSIDFPRGGLHAVGAKLWVSVLRVAARPEPSEFGNKPPMTSPIGASKRDWTARVDEYFKITNAVISPQCYRPQVETGYSMETVSIARFCRVRFGS